MAAEEAGEAVSEDLEDRSFGPIQPIPAAAVSQETGAAEVEVAASEDLAAEALAAAALAAITSDF